ncbi:MAG: F0F1 ATP synthase subunit A [Caldilineaceae bacterium]|nr:F0F1 ATP synthase subunit A [Caldilineaceae bacterium]
MELTPDTTVYWQWQWVTINATLVNTWIVMALLVGTSWLVTRRFGLTAPTTHAQTMLEALVAGVDGQIRAITQQPTQRLLPFVGTLFLFIAAANLLSIVPGFRSPTGSLSTTAALATCVFLAVPLYGIATRGLGGYLRLYIQPSPFMLPFNIIGELSRTLALAVRLFGNIMSGEMIIAILLSIVPLFFPVIMQLLGMLVGVIQAYIFAVLATVYIGSATAEGRKSKIEE